MARAGSILRNTFTVGAFTSLSRVLGLVREMMQSRLIGAGVAQSAFTLAFAIPNMARKLFGEGALTAAFVPVFRGEVERGGVEKAAKLARAVMTTVMLVLGAAVAFSLAGVLGASACAGRFGFSPRTRLALSLVAILLPYMLAICGAAFGMGILNALGKFKASSFMPALLNCIWISALGILLFFPSISVESRIRFVAAAILAGGFVQLAFMLAAVARAGVSPLPTFSGWGSEKLRLVWRNLGVAALGAGAVQVNYMLDQVLGQMAAPWAAGVIGYAERLMDLPLGVIGVAFGTVLLPTFSGLFAKGDMDSARAALARSVNSLLFVMVPAAVGLAFLAQETVAAVYEGGEFDAAATVRVSRALAVYAGGLCFFGFQKLLVPWFQAQNDMKTPLRVSLATVALNAFLNILAVALLPEEWRHVGLAASTVVCAAAGCVLLAAFAKRRNGPLGLSACTLPLLRSAAASAAMACAICLLRPRLASLPAIASLAAMIASGMAAYFVSVALLGGRVRLRRS
ncbi:MAG: murein biosynthesis integral membrane protein MurJ [Kiritimatiellae bacterium]|nr:murein biosynthesis integral membrane protein MurJ [Kiritimatiellia bacterium]